jgi:DNA-binding response OmpR family regulator
VEPRTILVADGDELVRRALGKTLAADGYRVIPAASTNAALQVGEPFDLALLDAFLDESARTHLPRELRRRHPGLPIVVMSGLPAAGPYPFADAVLAKPFTLEMLQTTLALALIGR